MFFLFQSPVGKLDPDDGKNRSKLLEDAFGTSSYKNTKYSCLVPYLSPFFQQKWASLISRRSQDDDDERIAFASNEWSQEAPENVNQDRKIFGRKLHLVWRFQRSGILLQLSTLEEMRMLSFLLFHLLRQF